MIAAYAGATLFPFRLELPTHDINPIKVEAGGEIVSVGIGVARTASVPIWLNDAIRHNSLRVDLTVTTADIQQSGPARILTLSDSHSERNLSVMQDEQHLVVLLRTPESGPNGEPGYRIERTFEEGKPVSLAIEIEDQALRIRVNSEVTLSSALPAFPLSSWNADYRLGFANEFDPQREAVLRWCGQCGRLLDGFVASGDSAWRGQIARADVVTPNHSVAYIPATSLVVPATTTRFHLDPEILPFFRRDLVDATANFLGFVPLGIVLSRLIRARMRLAGVLFAVAVAFGLSLSIEAAQFLVPVRSPSITDLLLNVAGVCLGFLLLRRTVFRARS